MTSPSTSQYDAGIPEDVRKLAADAGLPAPSLYAGRYTEPRSVCPDCGHTPDEDGDCMCVSVEALSLAWEAASGYDSIATIERVYTRSSADGRSGAYICCWPGCTFKRVDPERLWRHVHTAHHTGPGTNTLPPDDFDLGPWL